jgi:hypothetical protein
VSTEHVSTEQLLIDYRGVRRAIEYYFDNDLTDGLPVVPATESLVAEFLEQVDRDPEEIVATIPHLDRHCSVRLAAINAAMAGCRPEYFPVVLAALDAMHRDTKARGSTRFASGLWQSTTGSTPLMIINGPARNVLGFNSKGNVFGPGFRANATVGRAIRLIALNAFGLKPHVLDQATHATPGKYTCCIGENEEDSPWEPLSEEAGYPAGSSTLAFMMMRSTLHIEARSATRPEHLLNDLANSIARTGGLYSETASCCVVLGPEHAQLLHGGGFTKSDVKAFLADHAVCSRASLEQAGKTGLSRDMHWLVPADHPDAVPGEEPSFDGDLHHVLNSPDEVVVVVAGASNAGVSTIIDLMGSSTSRAAQSGGRVPAMGEIRMAGAS